ncbi:nucleoside transmembrane transporter [Starmerella bacillaris]|uniref:Nucleoside transmembrane transporter n=1 Tax=Starmerella bacillaris TaxID=1247836 RepID=A0AAV5RCS3_STABA|nr:nucleoside transmembrane transporter [Starmerella bacillaris]
MTQYVYGLIGASTLWPWNALITASALAETKLGDTPALYNVFSSVVMTSSTLTSFLLNIYLAYKSSNFRNRIVYGEVIIFTVFMTLTLLNAFTSGISWLVLMVIVAITSSFGTSFVQNGSMAVTQKMANSNMSLSIMNGQAVAGVLPPLLAMFFNSTPPRLVAPLTFLSVSLLSAAVLVLFSGLKKYSTLPANDFIDTNIEDDMSSEQDISIEAKHYKQVLTMAWSPMISVLLIFICSLSYPVFANNVHSSSFSLKLFSPLTHFIWNVGDLIGRILCSKQSFQVRSSWLLVILSVARFGIIGVLLVYVKLSSFNVWVYLFIMFLYGVTSGHLMSSAVVWSQKKIPHDIQGLGGSVLVLMMTFGLLLGSGASFLTTALI